MKKSFLVEKGDTGSLSFYSKSQSTPRIYFLFYVSIVIVFFFVALARLFQLTILKGSYYNLLSVENRVREIPIEAERGTILDRKGIVLVSNIPPNLDEDSDRITSRRIYDSALSSSHIIGYRQIADKADFDKDPCLNKLKLGDKVGKKGIEKIFECDLRGVSGKKLIEVDARGKYMKTLSVLPPETGKSIKLALDKELQDKALELIKDKIGAIAVMKPDTGEVLTMVSSPGFDPQVFEDGNTKASAKLIEDGDKPLFNRAAEGTYPPGSIFKLFVATAGLEESVIKPEDTIEDKGVIEAGPLKFHNWYFLEYGRVEGEVDMVKAIQRSNDTYFYLLGGKLGPDKIKKWAEEFGFNNITNIGIDESPGVIPSEFWKKDRLSERWFLGDTYNLSIGQGYAAVTPLQVVRATSVFANGGYLCDPKLEKLTSDEDKTCRKIPISANTYETVREGMKTACQTGGTGYPFFNFQVSDQLGGQIVSGDKEASPSAMPKKQIVVGCKTGTSESHTTAKPHAWFTVFAPFDKPEIAVAVLIEEGGQGSDIAAPIAKELLKVYFERYE